MTIYFIRIENEGPIKIGFTAGDPRQRMAQLQTGQPERLILLGTIPGERDAETGLHEHFGDHRKGGEWFNPTMEVVSVIDRLIKDQLPWYMCRDKSIVYESKISFLEARVAFLERSLNDPTEIRGPEWFRKRLTQETYRRREIERKFSLLQQQMINARKSG